MSRTASENCKMHRAGRNLINAGRFSVVSAKRIVIRNGGGGGHHGPPLPPFAVQAPPKSSVRFILKFLNFDWSNYRKISFP